MTSRGKPGSTMLYLIRHGESTPQAERIIGGMQGDRGLTSLGVAQAERLRDRLAATGEVAADVLIASTMPRARQTAEILAPAWGLPLVADDAVQEVRPGLADGMPVDQAETRFRLSALQHEPWRPFSPGGESWQQFLHRVGTALDRITHEYAGRTVVVVCHAGVIECAFLHFFHLATPAVPLVQFQTQNTSITSWQHRGNEVAQRWRLLAYNDAMHLFEPAGKPIDWGALVASPGAGVDRPAVPLPVDAPRVRVS